MANFELKNFIQDAIKRPGALTKKIGGKPSENIPKVRKLAKSKGLGGEQARFFLNALLPSIMRRKRKKSLLGGDK